MRVACIGTGLMGTPIARNLARKGFVVSAWNRTRAKVEPLRDEGIRVADNIAGAVCGADAAIVMVSTGEVADQVLFGPGAAATHLLPGSTVVMMSSIPVDVARDQATKLAARGIRYVDAPVSGGERGAIEAQLTIMAGGEEFVIRALEPIFRALGRVTHVGPVGSGQLAKLANQVIVGITIGAVAEALLLAEQGGADPKAVRQALLGGFADSTILRQHGERMIEGRFEPGAHAATQLKDLRTALSLADSEGLNLPITRQVEQLFEHLCRGHLAEYDHSALYLLLKSKARFCG
jgi:2-hydroxy-3-oxopropionate reductase